MLKEYTCIICPQGCDIEVIIDKKTKNITNIIGNNCSKGEDYVMQELVNPQRTLQSSVLVLSGELPLVSVKTSGSVARDNLPQLMDLINSLSLTAPITIGDILYENMLGLNINLIATKNVNKCK